MLVTSFLVAALVAAQDQPIIVEAPAKEAKVCRTERSTGSRVVKQVCKSAAEQKKDDQDARNKLGMGNRSNRPPEAFTPPTGN